MKRTLGICVLLLFSFNLVVGQEQKTTADLSDYLGGWRGELDMTDGFQYDVHLNASNHNTYVELKSDQSTTRIDLTAEDGVLYYGNYGDQLEVRLKYDAFKPILFFKIGHHLCHLKLEEVDKNQWHSKWNLLITESEKATLLLSVDKSRDHQFYTSLFFKEPTLHYFMCQDFRQSVDSIHFRDIRSRMRFSARLVDSKEIHLDIEFLGKQLQTRLTPFDYGEWNIGEVDHQTIDYNENRTVQKFSALTQAIQQDTLEQTHAVVISKGDKIIYEAYFDGFDRETMHDTRSVAKSFVSTLVGIAIKKGFLKSEKQKIRPFFDYDNVDWSNDKDEINIEQLLTMSSGLDAIDFGLNRMSFANEGNFQNSEDWSRFILSAPMVNSPGEEANYGSGSPQLLSNVLTANLDQPMEFFIHEELFQPLDIDHYRIQLTNKDVPYFGGGWYITPRDLVKFAQLYLREGNSKDQQSIVTKTWVDKSLKEHMILKNTFDQNKYGYYFWHKTYQIGERKIRSMECRGTGGQYVFIVPEEDVVVAITSGNYRNGKGFQPERIMEEYILPELLKQ